MGQRWLRVTLWQVALDDSGGRASHWIPSEVLILFPQNAGDQQEGMVAWNAELNRYISLASASII